MEKSIALVGASSGIGASLLSQLQANGENVHTFGRSTPPLSSSHFTWDVLEPLPDLTALPDTLNGLVYCPGTIALKPFGRFSMDDFYYDLQVNVLGAAKLIQALYPKLRKGNASIVLFSTVAVQTGMPFHSSIAMAKGAVEGLTRALAAEFAPHVRVNAIAPSLTQTPLADKLLSSPEKMENAAKRHPLNAIGNPSDIAALAAFLLSDNSKFMTGQVIAADGGMGAVKV